MNELPGDGDLRRGVGSLPGGAHGPSITAWRTHLGSEVSVPSLLAALGDGGTIPAAFSAIAASVPDRTALTIDGTSITFGELDEQAGLVARSLIEGGLAPSQRILLSSPSSIQFVVAYVGVLMAGGTLVLAGAQMTHGELLAIMKSGKPIVAAIAEGESLTSLVRIKDERKELRAVFALSSTSSLLEQLGDPKAFGLPTIKGSDVAILAHTSGTTGRPKGVPLTHANLLASIRSAMMAWRWSADDVLVHSLPLTHQHGLGGVHATLLSGSRAVILSRFDPEVLARTAAQERATVLFAVPAIYARLVEAHSLRTGALSALRLAVSGSAPLAPPLFEELSSLLRSPPLERYGTTESGLDISNPYSAPRKAGSVGLPLPGVEAVIVDRDEQVVADGNDGEIVLRGPQVFPGYALAKDSRSSFYHGGWFRTGDIGRVDSEDGYVSITGRIKDVIISGGLNVYPQEVELILQSHPGVRDVAVVGVPSARWGEEVVAFVVMPVDRFDASALIDFAREHLSSYKCPKRVIRVASIPKDAMGKLSRSTLRPLAVLSK